MPESSRVRTAAAALALLAITGCAPDAPAPSAPARSGTAGSTASGADSASATAAPTSVSPTPAGAKSSTYANALELGADGRVSYTPLRWYSGQAAQDQCEKAGISSPTAWCNDYYYETSGSPAEAQLTADTKITLLDSDGQPKSGTVAQVRQAVVDESWPNFRFWLVGDRIDRLEQVFTP